MEKVKEDGSGKEKPRLPKKTGPKEKEADENGKSALFLENGALHKAVCVARIWPRQS
jgi:hypothetical protein